MSQAQYRSLCASEPAIPIFSQDWWLDAVCGEDMWDVVLVQKGDRIVASLPYYLNHRFKQPVITMPTLTQFMGPWLRYPPNQKHSSRVGFELSVLADLIEGLPRFASFQQNFHYTISNWMPFYWKGFQQTTRYTYVLQDLSDLDRVFSEVSSGYRNKIKNAQEVVSVRDGMGISEFYDLNRMVFQRQNKDMPYTREFLQHMDQALEKRKSKKIFFAVDAYEKIHSALYLVWDKTSAYVHMVGEDPILRSSGAGILLIWKAIEFAKQILNLNRFDFEGSMIKSVEQVRRDFGAMQMPYSQVSKVNFLPFKVLSDIQSWPSTRHG